MTEPATGSAADASGPSGVGHTIREIVRYVPDGTSMPKEMWGGRHRNVLIAIAVQVPFLIALGLYSGTEPFTGAEIPATPLWMLGGFVAIILGTAGLANVSRLGRRQRTVLAAFSLMTVSMALVKLSGGYIEAHFSFFVFVAVLALYEDWVPFAVGVGYVAIGHGAFSLIDASLVYNHAAAIENPIIWGGIHAFFILGLVGALMVNWYSIEKSREEAQRQLDLVAEQKSEIQDVEEAKAEVEKRREEVERLNDHLETKADDYSATMDRAADGDLTVRLDAGSESEAMEQIGAAFNEMMDDIESTMRDVQSFAGEVSAASEKTVEGVDTAEARSEDVSRSVTEIAEGADEQREMLEQVSGEMNNLSATIEEVASSTETVADAAQQTASIANEGQDTAGEAIDSVGESRESIGATAEKVRVLDERMDDIGEIVDLISDIAEQTNLLALNANIEAARAGGGGGGSDGFAVVADEVKQLAEETQEAAQEIEELIAGTQSQTQATVEEVRTAEEHMEASAEAVSDAADAFAEVAGNAAETDDGIREISKATDDQAASTEETVSMVEEVAGISKSTADEADDVSEAADEQLAAMSQATAEAGSLADQAERLRALLRKFEVGGESPDDPSASRNVAMGDGGRSD
ncbi:methyl-accepting chemotaxis protein [Halorubrum sp. Ib24]|uniref:methyl-accepting chemotaxis protein n=1 Tax=unclassified Halorubrum TaxID=2642239 RepID=UPI000B98E710|nr:MULTISPECIES: methyl-accepting chemotaxis protein [unclassified Halorubrum]OYR38178.1 methyl-accepting chemotaxis protein [Halorubrum sp. Ib24]OYR39765.1 methyl-accepting chemotaxis protein [Halorubrum sp. Hd13]OYR48391.1 methyl-accepting chemotaxis protein [Halorubrum sp. Ea8]OYR53822.1 methyl-accepting chemotaxis protein [Halorubrum sp. Ea1]